MSNLLNGQTIVVTGGASGNGRAIAVSAAKAGARAVIVADIQDMPREGGRATHELVQDLGVQSTFVKVDVSQVCEFQQVIEAADEFGGITCMVNNAGILQPKPFLDVTEADFDRLMDINLKGVFFGAQAAARSMIAGGRRGTIINMSSVAGLLGSAPLSAYSASKGAVKLLTYSLAGALGPEGIRVNAVHPGVIETEMTLGDMDIANEASAKSIPLRRNGRPRDVADAVIYLASDMSSFVNGTSLVVDGGVYNTD